MTTQPQELYLIDAHEFNGTNINPLTPDRRVAYTGYLYNDKGPNLTVEEYLAHPRTTAFESPKVVTWDELEPLIKAAHRRLYTDKPALPVSDDTYVEMLSALPPAKMGTREGMEFFLMSERLTGSITAMYARKGEHCLTKSVDLYDRSTWITPADFASDHAAA